ncbi:cytochrome P450 [Aspergillus pseudoustus]|uniref:Cytochrome P450 n=1 Tax=Aspergillus pseudoustus TaxID=1810923 RepID=A0ABR4KB16_9EURO
MVLFSTHAGTTLAGVFSHVVYFNKGEHHLYGPLYLKLFFTTVVGATAALSYTQKVAWITALTTVSELIGSYLLGLYGSLLVYRLFLHPLNKFPGPSGARISAFWLSLQLRNNNLHVKLVELHQRYGSFVRIGSSDLSVLSPKAIEIVYGPGSRCIKGTTYDLTRPSVSLQLMRDPEEHHVRRRIWSGAFSDKLIRGYEQRVRGYRKKLVDRFTEMEGQPVNVKKWFNLYSFDVMGDLSFGKGFGSIERKEYHWAIRLLNATTDFVGLYLPAWAALLLTRIPGALSDFQKFLEFCGQQLMERFKNDPEIPDISSSLFVPLKGRGITEITPEEENLLYGDARLIVIAGSDTTSGALSAIFYELVRKPEEIEKLRAELAPYMEKDQPHCEFFHSKIAHLDHLNGVINEALRLYPAVPSGLQRLTPPEGIVIDGTHIPGGMNIFCPLYALARSEMVYGRPLEFVPERWYKAPELVKDKSAFAPFSIGPFNCIGRPLALMNMRTTVARLIMEFDMKLAPGEDGSRFLGNAKDNFVFYYGDLNLVFTRR